MMRIRRGGGRVDGWSLHDETPGFPGAAIVASGELDLSAVPELRRMLESAHADRLLLDLTEVTFIDSLSLATVVAAKRRMGPQGRLAVVVGHPYVMLIFQAGGLESVVDVFESRDEAERYLAA